jgi:hypothetical protein
MSRVPDGLYGWWFGVRGDDGLVREAYGERRVVRVGETLTYDGEPVVCWRGMHASPDALDGLYAAPSLATVVHRVRLGGQIVAGTGANAGKYAAQQRTVLWAADCGPTLRLIAAEYIERALLGERESGREPDARSWAAVEAARLYARREIGAVALAAARADATDAAWATLRTAAWAAVRAVAAADAAAADAAATYAARAAAARSYPSGGGAAARDAERRWQSQRLEEALWALAPAGAREMEDEQRG